MGIFGWWLTATIAAFFVATLLIWYRVRLLVWQRVFYRAKQEFRWQRERLEAKFVQIGQQRGGSTIRRWVDCDFDNEVTFVRSRLTGQLSAFVCVTITLENILPGMESVESRSNETNESLPPFLAEPQSRVLRIATGVFVYNGNHWDTDGRVVFNLSPSETIRFYRRDLEAVNE